MYVTFLWHGQYQDSELFRTIKCTNKKTPRFGSMFTRSMTRPLRLIWCTFSICFSLFESSGSSHREIGKDGSVVCRHISIEPLKSGSVVGGYRKIIWGSFCHVLGTSTYSQSGTLICLLVYWLQNWRLIIGVDLLHTFDVKINLRILCRIVLYEFWLGKVRLNVVWGQKSRVNYRWDKKDNGSVGLIINRKGKLKKVWGMDDKVQ